MWEVRDGIKLIARGGSIQEFGQGRHFLSLREEYMQYAIFNLPEGDEVYNHIHKERIRNAKHTTHEFFVLISGAVEITFYDQNKKTVDARVLHDGDFFCQHSAGHGFRILEPHTIFFEIKHGPFTTIEDDKERF